MGDRVGIIAGSGKIPHLIATEARRRGLVPVVAAIRGEADGGLQEGADAFEWFDAGDVARLLGFLRSLKICEVLFAGKISQKTAFLLRDIDAFASNILSLSGGKSTVRLIGTLINFLEDQGIRVLDPRPFLGACFSAAGILTRTAPGPLVEKDIVFGLEIARSLANLDIGQTVVVKDRTVIAVEGIEGTDQTIERGGELAGPGIVVVKTSRSNQDPRIDLPAAGLETIRSLGRAGAAAFCMEAGRVAFFDRDEAVVLADSLGIVLVARDASGDTGQGRSLI